LSRADLRRLEASEWSSGKALYFTAPPTTLSVIFFVVTTGDALLFRSVRTYGGAQKNAAPQGGAVPYRFGATLGLDDVRGPGALVGLNDLKRDRIAFGE